MNPRMLASVIVNNYNYDKYVGQAIDSALEQTYARVEVIVVDDGSTDGSRDIIASYTDRVVPILKENGGQASAFNAGFAACKGDIILFLDSDDVLLPGAVEHAVERFASSDAVKVYWPLYEIDHDGQRLGRIIPNAELVEGDLADKVLQWGPSACPDTPTSGNAWTRAFLERVLPMPEAEFRINSDCYLSTLAPLYGELRTIAEPLGLYRVHGLNQYVAMSVGEKSARQFEMYETRCDLLARHFSTARGIATAGDQWKNGNWHYDYLQRVTAASHEISGLVRAGGRFVLVDDGMWGDGRPGTPAVKGRTAIPFLECDGDYHGRPADSETAIRELERLRRDQGAEYVVVVWLAFWWLEYYADFAAYLRSSFSCVLENERLLAFDLRS